MTMTMMMVVMMRMMMTIMTTIAMMIKMKIYIFVDNPEIYNNVSPWTQKKWESNAVRTDKYGHKSSEGQSKPGKNT